MSTNFVYSYFGTIGLKSDKAYTHINNTLGIKLNDNMDEYECAEYKINMDYDIVYVNWGKNGMTIIANILNKISDALDYSDVQWALYDDINVCDVNYDSNGNHIETIHYEFNNEQILFNSLSEEDRINKEKELNARVISCKSSGYIQQISVVIAYLTMYTNAVSEKKGIENRVPVIISMFNYLYNNLKVFQEKNNNATLDDKINRLLIGYIDKINDLKIQMENCQTEIDKNIMNRLKEVLHNCEVDIKNLLAIYYPYNVKKTLFLQK